MSPSEEFAQWFARNAHRFAPREPDLNEADRVALWQCPDGWIVGYTTTRVERGPDAGRFVAVAYKPVGKGARSGRAEQHVMTYQRAFSTRQAAKARAEALYAQHATPSSRSKR